jgi:hypothetical protein
MSEPRSALHSEHPVGSNDRPAPPYPPLTPTFAATIPAAHAPESRRKQEFSAPLGFREVVVEGG